MRARRAFAIAGLLAASVLCVGLLELRIRETGDGFYRFLVWNLFLAWVPLVLAGAAYARSRRGVDPLTAALLVAWLVFFPNAPYLLTDFIHLTQGPAPLWYDALMLSAFAWTGLLLGFSSLYLVQLILRRAFGVAVSWFGVFCSLALASIGVYIGRFVRLNSWDVLLHPRQRRRGRPRQARGGAAGDGAGPCGADRLPRGRLPRRLQLREPRPRVKIRPAQKPNVITAIQGRRDSRRSRPSLPHGPVRAGAADSRAAPGHQSGRLLRRPACCAVR